MRNLFGLAAILCVRFLVIAAVLCSTLLLPAAPARAGVRLALGWGVDTTAAPVPEILHLWQSYLDDRPDSSHASPYWSAKEQNLWPYYDLSAPWVFQGPRWFDGLRVTVIDISPEAPDSTNTYVIRTLFSMVDPDEGSVKPLGLTRVYAAREEGRWVLSGAFLHETQRWERHQAGVLTFIVSPRHRFDQKRAERAASFVDSISAAFDLPEPEAITCVVVENPEELARLCGLDAAIPGIGGRAYTGNRLVFSGFPCYGEWYAHELVHITLAPLMRSRRVHPMVNEGLATWLGGSKCLSFVELMKDYAVRLREGPPFDFKDAMTSHLGINRDFYPVSAVLVKMVYEHGGIPAVKTLIEQAKPGNEEFLTTLERILRRPRAEIEKEWRSSVETYAGEPRQ